MRATQEQRVRTALYRPRSWQPDAEKVWFAQDSPVEGERFEPSVPVAKELVCVAEFELRGIEKGGNPRWDETVLPAGVLRFEKGESYSRWPQPARAPA